MVQRVVGIDPGGSTCISVLEDDGRGRPRLLGLWEVFGARHLWFPRLQAAVGDIHDRFEDEGWPDPVCWVEDWKSKGKGSRKVTRANAWIGLGRAQGAVMAQWFSEFGTVPALVPVATDTEKAEPVLGWASILGLPTGKNDGDGGRHRLREVCMYVDGARDRLQAITAAGRQVDGAEATLIGAACAMHLRSMRVAGGPA